MPTIKTLTVRRFRGIVDTPLEVDDRSVVLLGENGTGKSSFVDALEFFFTGKVAHLERTQGVSTPQHAPHIHGTREDTAVEIVFNNPNVSVIRTFKALAGANAALRGYLSLGSNSTFILRRKNLLDFILAQPAPRYQQLAAIIGVDELDKTERALMKARDDLGNARDTLARQVLTEEGRLKELLDESVRDDAELLDALNRRLDFMHEAPLASLDEAEPRKLAAVAHSRAPAETQRAVELQSVLNLAHHILQHIGLPPAYAQLYEHVTKLQQSAAQIRELLFREVLISGRRLIADFKLKICPLCLQPIDNADLLTLLEQRVRKAEAIAEKSATISRLRATVTEALKQQITDLERLVMQVKGHSPGLDEFPFQHYTTWLSGLLDTLRVDPVDVLLTPGETIPQTAPQQCAQAIHTLIGSLEAEKARLEPTSQDQKAVDLIDLLTRAMDSRNMLAQLHPQLAAKRSAYKEMVAICECFIDTKRTEVQNIYRELEVDIERYFKILHTDEGYEDIELKVNTSRRGSTEIHMDFHNREKEDPRAFNSEGHLDSLGLCIFLAFVKRFNAAFPLMVLDDVVSSIDAGHRQHICKLLFEEFPDYQLFITTHDYVWFEELCAHQRAYNKGHLFSNFQILDWSLDAGPRLDKYKPRWERAEEKLANGDKNGAAADTRKALEAFLYEAALAIQMPVVLRRDGKYVVSDLHVPFVNRFKKLVRDVYDANAAVFQDLETNGIFGNLLVHNNPQAGNASVEEVRGFINAVKNLEALFTCAKCGRLVEYHRSANLMKCRCGDIMWLTKG